MQNVTQVDSFAGNIPSVAAETGGGRGVGLTLVVQSQGYSSAAPAIALNLTGPAPRVVHSFPEACTVLLSEPVAVVLLVDSPDAAFSESVLDVIGKLAGTASIVLVQPWRALQAGTPAWEAQTSAPSTDTDPSRSLAVGTLHYNPMFGRFKANDQFLNLSHAETRLLLDVISAPGQCIAVKDLANGHGVTGEQRSYGVVRQYVHRIRRKLSGAGDPALLVSTRSGYALLSPDASGAGRYRRVRSTVKTTNTPPLHHNLAEDASAPRDAAIASSP